jgi:hypothetical protein
VPSSGSEFFGRCLCGAVRFRATPPTLFCAHCHCQFCRRAHGAAFVTWVGVREGQFTVLGGNDRLKWHASSKQGRRGFCSACGSPMFFTSSLCPGEVHIALAHIDGPIDREPGLHVFFDSHVEWFPFTDALPRLSGESEELAHYKKVEAEPNQAT